MRKVKRIQGRQTEDTELEYIADLLREIDGIQFINAHFGHSEDPEMENHHATDAVIGVLARTTEGIRLIEAIVHRFPCPEHLPEKHRVNRWCTITVSLVVGWNTRIEQSLGGKADIFSTPFFTITVHPNHNPTFDEKGIDEKLYGIKLLQDFLEGVVKKMRNGIDSF